MKRLYDIKDKDIKRAPSSQQSMRCATEHGRVLPVTYAASIRANGGGAKCHSALV